MSGRRGERSREDTWGEQELGKYIGKQKTGPAYGSPKAKPRARDKGPGSHSRDKDAGSHSRDKDAEPHSRDKDSGSRSRDKDTGSHSRDKDTGSRSKDKEPGSHFRSTQKSDKSSARHSQLTETHTPKSSPAAGRRESSTRGGRGRNEGQQRNSGSTADRPRQVGERGKEKSERDRGKEEEARGRGRGATRGRGGDGERERGGRGGQSKDQEPKRLPDGQGRERVGIPRGGERQSKQRDGETRLSSGSMGSFPLPQGQEPGAPIGDELLEQERQRKTTGAEKKAKHNSVGDGAGKGEQREAAETQGIAQAMVEVAGDEEYQYEDEEEEDYEEDFDEEIESSSEEGVEQSSVARQPVDLVEIMQAIDAENQFVRGHLEGQSALGDSGVVPSAPPLLQQPSRTFIDFSQVQRREVVKKAARKTRKRGQELLSMIELDIVAIDLFTLAPQSEYEVYIKNFGSSGTQQA